MKTIRRILIITSIFAAGVVGYAYGRRDATIHEHNTCLKWLTIVASGIRRGRPEIALNTAERGMDYCIVPYTMRYNKPSGPAYAFWDAIHTPADMARVHFQAFELAQSYISDFKDTAISAPAVAYINDQRR
jgi:hypothetical protein